MRNFYIDLYMKSKEDWKNLLRKQGKAVELLKEVTNFSSPMVKKDVPATTTDGAVDKKRKRKRNRVKATHQKFDDDEDEDDEAASADGEEPAEDDKFEGQTDSETNSVVDQECTS